VQAYGGTISGQFVVNGRKGLSVGGDLTFVGMDLQNLLRDFAGYERLVGTGDLRLKFLGSGPSVDAIMQGLEGSGTLALGRGEILGLDIGGMIRTLDTSYVGEGQKTIFDSLNASFTIAGGVLQNDDLIMAASFARVAGEGKLGLGARTINYRLRAEADLGEQSLTAPILIKGPWADPKISLDLEALAREKLDLEKAKLEAEARVKALEAETKAKAKAKLEEELGVVQGEGETLEEAIKRRANEAMTEEAAKALEELLNGN
jgi:AsmA protein